MSAGPAAAAGVGGEAKRGIAWLMVFNVGNQAFQFGIGIVLARLLTPADFGIFAITGIFTGLAATVASVGLGSALIQRRTIEEAHRRSMLAANLVSSALIVLILTAGAPLVSSYFKSPLAGPVLALCAWNFILNALCSVSFSVLMRDLRFKPMAMIDGAGAVAAGLTAIVLALRGFGVWSIAVSGLAQAAVRSAIMIPVAGWRPAVGFDRRAFGELVGYGIGMAGKRVINYSAANVDNFVIGRRLGPSALGYYSRAYSLMTLPLTQLSRVIMSVLFPAFSRMQDDDSRLVAGYSKVVLVTSLVSFPFLCGLALVARAFIAVVYGEKWLATALPLQIMCAAGMMKAITTFCGSVVDAKGKIGAEVRRQLVYLGLLVGGALIGSRFGINGVAVAVVISSLAMLFMMQALLSKLIGMRWRSYGAALAPALAGTGVMAAAVGGFQALAGPRLGWTSPAYLFASAAVGAPVYVAFLLAAPFGVVRELRRELGGDLARLLKRWRTQRRPDPMAVERSRWPGSRV